MAFAQIDDYFIERLHLLTRNEIVVYTYLVKKRNNGSGQCNPKQSTIARETNLQTPRVSEAVKGLEAKGWAICDEFGEYVLPEKVTESVTTQVTNSVRKSYGKRKKKLRNAEVAVTQCVTEIKGIENTIEKTKEKTKEKREDAHTPAPKHEKVVGNLRGIPVQEIIGEESGDESEFFREVVDGLKTRLNTPTRLPNERKWLESVEWSWQNRFPLEQTLEVFDLLEKIRKKKKAAWSVSPELWQSSIPKIESLRIELENLEQNGATNGTHQATCRSGFGESPAQKRERESVERQQLRRFNRERREREAAEQGVVSA